MAAFIPEEKIADIKNAADIVDIVSEAVLLKKQGKNYVGLCPFHSEKTPSFTVSPDKQIFHCFGCGSTGNVFGFLKEQEGLSFPEAARMLAARYGIALPTQQMTREQRRSVSERERIIAVNREATGFFSERLTGKAAGSSGMAYLNKRGMRDETIEGFNIGYAPKGWETLVSFFSERKVSLPLVEKAGLILTKRSGKGYYDRFRDRVIFPITNMSKQVIGFGGRAMDDSLPKYLNSPETPVYRKSRSLYGLCEARRRCRETDTIHVVEGYFDCLTLFQNGISNVAATLGTALTPEHIRLMRGHATKVILVFDSDEAGIGAALRSVGLFMKESVDARIMVLPPGHDPDSYVSEFGPESFEKAASEALGIVPFLIHTAIGKHGLTVEGKIRIVADLVGPLASIVDRMARSLYIRELAETIDVGEPEILAKVREHGKKRAGKVDSHRRPVDDRGRGTASGPSGRSLAEASEEEGGRFERQIISMMLQFPEILPEVEKRGTLHLFKSDTLKSIGRLILEGPERIGNDVSEFIQQIDDPKTKGIAARLNFGNDVWNLQGCCKLLDQYEISRNRQEKSLVRQIRAAEKSKDHELLVKLLKDKQLQIGNAKPVQ